MLTDRLIYRNRPIRAVPFYIITVLIVLLMAQVALGLQRQPPRAGVEPLPEVPALPYLQALSLGDPPFLSRLLVLWLQAHDYQQGISLSYKEVDYARLADWLEASLALDPGHDYPMLLASRVYATVDDPERQRLMLDFVAERFGERPAERWRWMAHAIYVARHRLGDERLALEYARLLANQTQSGQVPEWARQMHIFIMADMGQVEAAKVLLGALAESGELDDPAEKAYLLKRIEQADRQ